MALNFLKGACCLCYNKFMKNLIRFVFVALFAVALYNLDFSTPIKSIISINTLLVPIMGFTVTLNGSTSRRINRKIMGLVLALVVLACLLKLLGW